MNLDSIRRTKNEDLSKLLLELNIFVILIQETHAHTEEDIRKRGKFNEYHQRTYGTATYLKPNIEHAQLISVKST